MFEKENNYPLTDKKKLIYENRLCPDTKAIKDWMRLKNEYSNDDDRKSFSV